MKHWYAPLAGPLLVIVFTLIVATPHRSFWIVMLIFLALFTALLWKTRRQR